MHSFAHRHHSKSESDNPSSEQARGSNFDHGWRYDLMEWFLDRVLLRGTLGQLRQRTIALAGIQPGESVLDVGCGTGSLAMNVRERTGASGSAFGIDPSASQIARARSKALRLNPPIDFRVGGIEHLPFPDGMFDVVLSTLMMHHISDQLKHQGLGEIARVLKPAGRLVIADLTPPKERQGPAKRFHAGGTGIDNLRALVIDAGFTDLEMESMPPQHSAVFPGFHAFPGAGFLRARKANQETGLT